jgi:hypothetical protein
MMRQRREMFFALLFLLILVITGCSSSTSDDGTSAILEETIPEDTFLAGANASKLVPEGDPTWYEGVYMGGFGMFGIRDFGHLATGEAQGVNDPPYVRSMVITQGSQAIAIAVIDATVIGNRIIREITKSVTENTGIPESNVFIAGTHSHSSLDLLGAYGSVPKDYRKFIIEKSVSSVVDAYENRQPARLMVSSVQYNPSVVKNNGEDVRDELGRQVTWTYNRRGWPNAEDMYLYPDGDKSINVLEAKDYSTGKSIGVMVNYGCHPVLATLETRKLSRDFCGYLVDYVQKQTGAPTVFIQGTLGDTNPGDWDMIGVDKDNCYGFAKQFGEDVAKQALASMSEQVIISNEMHVAAGPVEDVNIDNPLMVFLFTLLNKSLEIDYEGNIFKGITVDTQVNYIRLGNELQIAMLPGEAVSHMALGVKEGEHTGRDGNPIAPFDGIKDVMTAPFKIVTSITGDTLIYLVPSQEWKKSPSQNAGEDSYEESMSISTNGKFGDTCLDKTKELIAADK